VSNEAFRKTTKIQRTGDSGTRVMCVSGYTSVSASSIHGRTFELIFVGVHLIQFLSIIIAIFFFIWNFEETFIFILRV